jgi:coenzyme F420-dependent glucose-6-phosphate dehydrogenase
MNRAPLKLGYKASSEQFGPTELLDYAVLAETVGLDSVRVLIGTSVLTPTFRYHPSIVAQAFATLGVLFPGRVALGVGTGESLNEVPASGMVWPEQKERTARFKEAIDLIRRLWREEQLTYEGTFYKTVNATIYDRPELPVPIYVAAAGPVMAKFAGEHGDGFICTSGKSWDLYTQTLLPNVQTGVEQAGEKAFDRMIEIKLSFDIDRDRALQDTRFWGALALRPEEKLNVENALEMERLADALPVERAASRWIVSNDPEEIVQGVGKYVELGFNHLVFHAPGPDQSRFLKLFGEQLAPRLRAVFA